MSLEMTGGIYSITNAANGRRYIGSAVNFSKRFREHRNGLRSGKHFNDLLQRAWAKYGEQSFSFDRIVVCAPKSLLLYEQRAIDAFNSAKREYGYNLSPTAGSPLGLKRSAETRALQSALKKGKPSHNKGKPAAAHVVAAMRAGIVGKPAWNRGLKFSDESRKKMSDNHVVHGHEGQFQRNQTHCKHGHVLFGDNVYVPPKNPTHRHCKACMKLRDNNAAAKRRTF